MWSAGPHRAREAQRARGGGDGAIEGPLIARLDVSHGDFGPPALTPRGSLRYRGLEARA